MSDNQGRRTGEGKIETNNQRSRENSGGDSSGQKGSSGQSQSNRTSESVKDSVSKTLGK